MTPPAPDARSTPPHPEAPAERRAVAIVVAYNSAGDLAACLEALEAQRGVTLEIHVVDNASTDGTAALVRDRFPRARLAVSDRNLGFARANNRVLERVAAPAYVLVNPDAVLHPDAVATCLDHLGRDPAAGVVATRLVHPDGSPQRSCFGFLDLANLFGETIGAHRFLPRARPLASFHMPWFAHDRAAEVDWIQGAFLVVRGDVIRTVGAFDPAFFMYGEEMDWCRRIRAAGWKVVFLPDPPVVHAGGTSSAPVAGPMFVENLKGRLRYLRKHHGPIAAAAARAIIAASVILRAVWREAQGAAARVRGGVPDERAERRRRMFRAALRWVGRGLPLSAAEAEIASGAG